MYFYKQTQDFHKPISKEPKFFKNRYQENYESQACEFLPTQLELVEAQKERERFEAQITVQAPITDIKDFEYKETAYIFQESSQPKLENSQPYMTQKQLPGYRFLEKQRNEQYQLQNCQQKKVSRVKLDDELQLDSDEDEGYITQQSQCLIQKVIPQIKSEFSLNFNKTSYKPQHASTSSTLTSSLQSPKFQLRAQEPILIKKQIGYPGAFNSNKFTMNRKDEKEQKYLIQNDVVQDQDYEADSQINESEFQSCQEQSAIQNLKRNPFYLQHNQQGLKEIDLITKRLADIKINSQNSQASNSRNANVYQTSSLSTQNKDQNDNIYQKENQCSNNVSQQSRRSSQIAQTSFSTGSLRKSQINVKKSIEEAIDTDSSDQQNGFKASSIWQKQQQYQQAQQSLILKQQQRVLEIPKIGNNENSAFSRVAPKSSAESYINFGSINSSKLQSIQSSKQSEQSMQDYYKMNKQQSSNANMNSKRSNKPTRYSRQGITEEQLKMIEATASQSFNDFLATKASNNISKNTNYMPQSEELKNNQGFGLFRSQQKSESTAINTQNDFQPNFNSSKVNHNLNNATNQQPNKESLYNQLQPKRRKYNEVEQLY